jgi:hypothetical protein
VLITVDNRTATRLLRIYGISTPVMDDGTPAARNAALSTPVTIDGVSESESCRSIRLKIDGKRCARTCPISDVDAQSLVSEFHMQGKADRTLVQLLVKSSKLYEDSGISELHLLLYLTEDGYRTHAVYMLRRRSIPARRALPTR